MGDVSFSVDLREPISYSLYILITGLALMAVALVVFFIFWKRWINYQNGISKVPRANKKKPIVLSYIRAKYLRQIARLEKGLAEQKTGGRIAYQELSRIIRAFVHEATGLDVQNYTYMEIKALNIPGLTALVESYYHPEFAPDATSDRPLSSDRALEAVRAGEASNFSATGEVMNPDTQGRTKISPALAKAIQNTKGVITTWR